LGTLWYVEMQIHLGDAAEKAREQADGNAHA